MRVGNLMSSTLATTSTLLLQLDSQMTYASNLIDEESNRRQSGESNNSSKSIKKVNAGYMDLARRTFDPSDYLEASKKEGPYICSKLTELLQLAQFDAE